MCAADAAALGFCRVGIAGEAERCLWRKKGGCDAVRIVTRMDWYGALVAFPCLSIEKKKDFVGLRYEIVCDLFVAYLFFGYSSSMLLTIISRCCEGEKLDVTPIELSVQVEFLYKL